MEKMMLVGLGNPGNQFEYTRHNLGIRAVLAWYESAEKYAQSMTDWKDSIQLEAKTAEAVLGNAKIICVFPLTFMNDSGKAVKNVMEKYAVNVENILVAHDDMELPFGDVQWSEGGSAKGHNGIRSIYQSLDTQAIRRLRLGIGRPPAQIAPNDFVLAKFSVAEEQELAATTIPQAVEELAGRISAD